MLCKEYDMIDNVTLLTSMNLGIPSYLDVHCKEEKDDK